MKWQINSIAIIICDLIINQCAIIDFGMQSISCHLSMAPNDPWSIPFKFNHNQWSICKCLCHKAQVVARWHETTTIADANLQPGMPLSYKKGLRLAWWRISSLMITLWETSATKKTLLYYSSPPAETKI